MPLKTIEVPEIWILSKWAIGDVVLDNNDGVESYTISPDGKVVDRHSLEEVNLGKLLYDLYTQNRMVDIQINHLDCGCE